jgi:hypothetical protein
LNESFPTWKTALAAMVETQSLAAAFVKDEAQSRINWQARKDILTTGAKAFFPSLRSSVKKRCFKA